MAGAITVGAVQVTVTPDVSRFGDDLKNKLGALAAANVKVDADTSAAQASIDALLRGVSKDLSDAVTKGIVDGLGKAPARAPGQRKGEEFGGAFADSARARIEAALKALPKVEIDANSSDADIKIQTLRASLEELSGKRIGVDISADEALAQLAAIRQELEGIDHSYPVDVQVNAARALAQLAALQAEVDKVANDDPTVTVDADTSGAQAQLSQVGNAASSSIGGLNGLTAAGIGLGPAIIPVAAAVAAALAGIGTAAAAGLAGIGVLALGFSGVGAAVKALGQQQQSAGKDAAAYGRSQQSAAFAIANAQAGVQGAEESLANARANAANSAVTAAERVSNAERSLQDAEQGELQAQQALTQARKDAQRQLVDLANAQKDADLAVREGQFTLADRARQLANARLTEDPGTIARAQLHYDEAKQNLSELQLAQRRAADAKTAADKAGVDGSQQVISAQQGVAAATQKVADAQRSLADARREQANQERQSAAAISAALRGVDNAERSLTQAHASAAAGAATAAASTNKLSDAMSNLSPAGQQFARFLFSLKPQFDALKAAAQNGLLPGVEAGIKALLPVMPSLTKFVGSLATEMGNLFRAAGQALTSPFWQQAIGTFTRIAGPDIAAIGRILGDIATGFAGLFVAFAPIGQQVIGGIASLADAFASFGRNAAGGGLRGFLSYAARSIPVVVDLVGNLARITATLVQAFAPLGLVLLQVIDVVSKLIAGLGPQGLLLVIGGVAAAVAVFTGGFGAIVLAGTAVAALLVNLYESCEPFRKVVNEIGDYIGGTLVPIFQGVFSDALDGIKKGFGYVQDAVGRNRDEFGKLFDVLGAVADFAVTKLLPIYGTYLKGAFEVLGQTIGGLIDIMGHVIDAAEFLTKKFLDALGFVIDGAARLFGGLPGGIGDSLKKAAKEFDTFRDQVNKSLDGVKNKTVSVTVTADFAANRQSTYNQQVPAAARRAGGGIITGPGTATSDSIPAMLSNGEYVVNAAATSRNLPLLAAINSGRGYANGGLVLRDAFPAPAALSAAASGLVTSVAQAGFGSLLGSAASPGSLAGGVARWTNTVLTALALLGQPASLLGSVLRRIGFESGGNPNAINLTDSNALAGHPSQGLMQVIPSTFAAYAGPLAARGLTDPLANTYAGLNYAEHRYGSIAAIDPLVRPYGYDSGGMLEPGVQLVYNGTGRPERVLDAQQTQVFEQAMAGAHRGGGDVHVGEINNYTNGDVTNELTWALRGGLI